MILDELLSGLPPELNSKFKPEDRRKLLVDSNLRVAVIDDDPTGTQTVHEIFVYMDWSIDTLVSALSSDIPIFYISTNSRGLDPETAEKVSVEVGENLKKASEITGHSVLIISRSDSTLRGHFPLEVDALNKGFQQGYDGLLIAPAFFEAGRYTINDIHWVNTGVECIRADETEFANDPVFGYKARTLPLWVEEKTKGRFKASDVKSITLEIIRLQGVSGVLKVLEEASNGVPIIVNAAGYSDLDIVSDAVLESMKNGKNFFFRCAASIVKSFGGFLHKPLLSAEDFSSQPGPGLIIAGSYVGKTSRQLQALEKSGHVKTVELQVDSFVSEDEGKEEIFRCVEVVSALLEQGENVVLHTSRTVRNASADDFLEYGKKIMDGLCSVVRLLKIRPSFLIAKGGITSLEIARTGIGIRKAYVKGQIAKGIAVWETGEETKWPGIDYIVFPGNVGEDETLAEVVERLLAAKSC